MFLWISPALHYNFEIVRGVPDDVEVGDRITLHQGQIRMRPSLDNA